MNSTCPHQNARRARRSFTAMAGAYSCGVFNDNFYKQAALILAVAAGQTSLQGYALAVFTLPFILAAAPAGWLADHFAKRQVIIACKWLELLAMLLGAAGMLLDSWPLIFGMLAVMGLQATLFSPALNGSIPELYPPAEIIRANAILRTASTTAILLGVALSGVALDCPGLAWGVARGRWCVGLSVLALALLGLAFSYGMQRHPPLRTNRPFPWSGPWHTWQSLRQIARDKYLSLGLSADVLLWFMGALQILIINPLGINQFSLSKTATSLLIVTQLAGIAAGGFASAKLVTPTRWQRLLLPAGGGMALTMMLIAGIPYLPANWSLPILYSALALVGFWAGLFLIPVESFLQLRADPQRKGEVWASANFVVFAGILLAGPLSNIINLLWQPTSAMGVIGVGMLAACLALHGAFRRLERSSLKTAGEPG